MNAEFNWWLLIVGLVLGAALTWLVMSESVRRDVDITESEQGGEARWIATAVSAAGRAITPDRVEEILKLHREYLAAPPPDDPIESATTPAPETLASDADASDTMDRGDAVASPPEGRLERDA
jgi:predicted O-methyltransferase YrrM